MVQQRRQKNVGKKIKLQMIQDLKGEDEGKKTVLEATMWELVGRLQTLRGRKAAVV